MQIDVQDFTDLVSDIVKVMRECNCDVKQPDGSQWFVSIVVDFRCSHGGQCTQTLRNIGFIEESPDLFQMVV
jgi:hypothetical protein